MSLDVHPVSASHVDIVVPAKNVVEEVTKFHSTVVMNYITYYGVVSLYPSWTMSGVGMIVKKEMRSVGAFKNTAIVDTLSYVTMVNDLSLLPMGKQGQGLDLQVKRSTFNEETFFKPFDDVAPSLSTFEAEEIRWTLGKTCTGRERSKKIDKHWNMCVLGLACMRGVVWLNQNRKFVYGGEQFSVSVTSSHR